MALGMLVNGKWTTEWTEHDESGNFQRMQTKFRGTLDKLQEDDRGRYSLYVSYACPWAHRTIMTLQLLGLQDFVNLIVVEPHVGEMGWYFSEKYKDKNYGFKYLQELYLKADSNYTGRVTVPVLWDGKEETIVNNESLEIIKMFNDTFREFSNKKFNLFDENLSDKIAGEIDYNYDAINNACYRTGFAKSQEVYELEVTQLFKELEKLDAKLAGRKFLVGDSLTGADISLLPTLLRFDVAYHGIFKCNIKRLKDFQNIERYKNDLLAIESIANTFKPDQIKSLYYKVVELNPSGIVPLGQA
ncbi:MAG: glutathione-dependent reductase [Bdellovibrionaceae bacterium]|nr:glutathione-dependent reductase [Pseudobdellovibrionaceae bacterium]